MDGCLSKEHFDKGYAVRTYNINNDISSWRFMDKVVDLKTGAVPTEKHGELTLARWSDVYSKANE